MITRLRNIGLLILLLLAGRMAAQVPVLDSVCYGAVRHYRVDGDAGSTYTWILTPPIGPAVTLPSDADTLEMIWTYPSGDYELKAVQHAENRCDADAVYGKVVVVGQPEVNAGPDDVVCVDDFYKLTNATADFTSSLLWTTDGDGTFSDPTALNPAYFPGPNDILAGIVNLRLTGFGIVADGGCDPKTDDMVLSIVSVIVPQFEPIGPFCQYNTAPALPDTSLDGISGTWDPAVITTDILGDFFYTFSPTDTAGCGVDTILMITITDQIEPKFDPIGPLCINIVPPALPDASLEGITGTWSPDTISTDVPGTFTYLFTPGDPAQCGVETSMDIDIVTDISPAFDPIGPLCQYITPPSLPGVSLNGISGTWVPPVIDTDVPGIFDYTFTPDPDQCGLDTTIFITIIEQVDPLFDTIGLLCQYSTAPPLPGISLNGITGTWSPAWINTTVPGTFTFTFTPNNPGQCGTVVTMNVTILEKVTPEFDPIGPLCLNSTPPVLPDTSLNGITGTWNPPVITTDVIGTFFYKFTPDSTYQCVSDKTLLIYIIPDITPEFDSIGPLCQYSVPQALPDSSLEGITGTWVPDTINTTIVGISTYTFTPDTGQCAVEEVMIEIEITDQIIPEFNPIGPYCQNSVPPALPATDINGVTGTWTPPVINTDVTGTFSFTFTPDTTYQCALDTTILIAIVSEIVPEFNPIGPLCQNIPAPALPDTDINGVTGTWTPPVINTDVTGTFSFTFTPDTTYLCASDTTILIAIVSEITPEFDTIGPFCLNDVPPDLPSVSNNGITGSWNPLIIDTSVPGTSTYTFTPDDPSQCGTVLTMDITIDVEIMPEFDQVASICRNSPAPVLEAVSNNNVSGTWSPAVINTTIPGTAEYTFTPDDGQCGATFVMEIVINDNPQVSQTIVTDETNSLGNGSIEIIATGPAMPLNYSIDNGTSWQTGNGLFLNLSAGTYLCVVKDDNECDTSFALIITNIGVTILQAITIPGGHCLGDAAIVPIEVNNFISVAEFQLKLSYNADNLLCEGYANVHPQLADNFIAWIDQINGVITMQWQDVNPGTFPSLEKVCDLFYTPKQPGQGQLDWYTAPSDSYFKDPAGMPIMAEFETGQMTIYDPPSIILPETETVCEGANVTIVGAATGLHPPLNYLWTYPDGHSQTTDPIFDGVTQSDAGEYILLVTDSLSCNDQKSIRLVVSANPVAAFHGTDSLTVPPGYVLEAGSGLAFYQWNTGEMTESIEVDTTGWYWVDMVSTVGCIGTDSVYVIVSEEILYNCLYIPNAFTPNNDGRNDTFQAVSKCVLSMYHMWIYNRWGEKLFESGDISDGWDGRKNGVPCMGGVYVYKIVYKAEGAPESSKDQVETGTVTIVK